LKILGYDYRIEREVTADGINALARLHHREQIIQVASDLTEKGYASALLHEVLEALNYHLELGLEHRVIMSLEAALFQVLVDNGVDLLPLGMNRVP